MSGSQSPWSVDDRHLYNGNGLNPELIRSNMNWREVNPGRVAPTTWPRHSLPMTNDNWIACQDSIKDKLAYTLALPDPSVCNDPPLFCYDTNNNANTPGCHAQGMWKKDNMWSPRRGLGAAWANEKIFVIGGQSMEYGRIDDLRLIGGLGGQKRIETVQDHFTVHEDLVLKNDIWSSDDRGVSWKLVSPGCKDPQEDVLMQTEVWSKNHSNQMLPQFVGSIASKCVNSSDCYGVAECKTLGTSIDKVCVCPIFSPRMHHSVTVQHRFSIDMNNTLFSEDVMYVVGGFITVKQAFCANKSCGPTDGYRLAIDDAWMSTNGKTWIQIKPAFSTFVSFRGRGSHSAVVVYSNNHTSPVDQRDNLFIFGGETLHPQQHSTVYLNDIWRVDLPTELCCNLSKGCSGDWIGVQNNACMPKQSDWKLVTSKSKWSARSGHSTVYEPRSHKNAFNHRIYLSGGINSNGVQSDYWTWNIASNEWRCDFCLNDRADIATSAFVGIGSSLSEIQRTHLPNLGEHGELYNFTTPFHTSVASAKDIAIMAENGVKTVMDLATADLHSVLHLRGFTFPGSHSRPVSSVCYLRSLSIAIVNKCTTTRSILIENTTSKTCGRGGNSKPCEQGDWDGCNPIPGVDTVDVYGLGDVAVPQTRQNPSSAMEEILCRQVPSSRYYGAAVFWYGKVLLLGGIGNSPNRLFRDVWARDDSYPQAIITSKPANRSSQSQFYFDSNESDDVVFEYKLLRDESDIIPWTITTKAAGANLAWLDDKEGGPGRGRYSLYVRAVKPSGNRDDLFSTKSNVFTWYYIPPIPWRAVVGYLFFSLVILITGYYGYRRHKKRVILQQFQLRRLKRKFKLRAAQQHSYSRKVSSERKQTMTNSRRSDTASFSTRNSSFRGRPEDDPLSQTHIDANETRRDRPRSMSNRSRSRSMRSDPYEAKELSHNQRIGRRKFIPDGRPGDETRNRRRREREKLRRNMRHV